VAHTNVVLLRKVLADIQADVVAITVEPELQAYSEKGRLSAQGGVVGFRRLYCDAAEPVPLTPDWPHHVLVRAEVYKRLLPSLGSPQSFSTFLERCRSSALRVRAICAGGVVFDLATEQGLLGLLAAAFNSSPPNHLNKDDEKNIKNRDNDSTVISDTARLFGKILFGQNVSIGRDAIVVGPTIIGSNAKVEQGAVVRASIIGPNVSVPSSHLVQNRVIVTGISEPFTVHSGSDSHPGPKQSRKGTNVRTFVDTYFPDSFRIWPRFSYARCLKRIADIAAAVSVLVLFAPVLPIVALTIKLTSRGPVFFRDNRQGLHGKPFKCLKFRTMLVGADKMQEKLRVVNQADGPQFKVADDPRTSAVGRFLRDTYIDEIPQFFNVLLGQMSAVGPRPSPEAENTSCPYWRDARLSVRPGITGLWQVSRTRQPMKDFQEWIHYDIKYVRHLSLKLDLWISWQTVKKIVKSFVSQF
jgi:lipopolysaccharide/colanic/teichoic acid biosynthesis glycosyltransferase